MPDPVILSKAVAVQTQEEERFRIARALQSGPAQVLANAAVEISLRRRSLLKDLTAFVGLQPSYWVQLRISGRGLKIVEQIIEDLFAEVGYRCEEWVGVEGSDARLGIFGTIDVPNKKMVFCLESTRHRLRCDLLVPVNDGSPAACPAESAGQA